MKKKPTIGINPLDAVIPRQEQPQDREQQERDKDSKREYSERKERLTVHISGDLIERLRDAVYWTPGLTLAGLAEAALRAELDRLEADRGEPFPKRKGDLPTGRPVS